MNIIDESGLLFEEKLCVDEWVCTVYSSIAEQLTICATFNLTFVIKVWILDIVLELQSQV